MGTSVGAINPQLAGLDAGCDHSGEAAVHGLTPQSVGITLPGTWYLAVSFVELVGLGDALVWSKAGHSVCWFLGLLGGALVSTKVSCHLCRSWGHLVGAAK